jgi:cytochrome P450
MRMLGAEHEGRRLDDAEAALELHHFVAGGFITYGLLGGLVTLLGRHPDVRERVRDEALSSTPWPRLPYLRQVVLEAKRMWPVVPVVCGRARRTFTCAGRRIPQGHLLLMAVHSSNRWPEVYDVPSRFDPKRFAPERAEHERRRFGFAPHGVGPHRCPGETFATQLCAVFVVALLRGYRWELVSPGTELRWDRSIPEPRDGLRVRLERAVAPITARTAT